MSKEPKNKELECVEKLYSDVKMLNAVVDDKKMFRHKIKTMLTRIETYLIVSRQV